MLIFLKTLRVFLPAIIILLILITPLLSSCNEQIDTQEKIAVLQEYEIIGEFSAVVLDSIQIGSLWLIQGRATKTNLTYNIFSNKNLNKGAAVEVLAIRYHNPARINDHIYLTK